MTPTQSLQWIEESLIPVFPLGVYRDRTEEAESYIPEMPRPTPERVREVVCAEAMRAGHAASRQQPANPSGNGGKQGDVDSLRIKIAGFGGQGVLYLGETIAEAGMEDGLHVSWLPSYGPEMRGGTAHCHVTVARRPIGSPLVEGATHLIAMNRPSLERFQHEVVPGGVILYNSSLIEIEPDRDDVTAVAVPATRTASDLGSIKIANMVMLGALLAHAPMPSREAVLEGFAARTTGSKAHVMELNRKALLAGLESRKGG
jgi:Pyruvate/2-oxoacid:ferredoxin oxidoreductase gamma subunit